MTLAVARDLGSFQFDMTATWKSFDVATVNGNAVRLRVMQDVAAKWHVHESSDELFYVFSGTVSMETEHGTREISAGQLFVVPAGTQHRARVVGRATMLVIDGIG
jgi:mannose-6-phosphate isomerase-like protein (cupin superfamily)